MLRRGRRYRRTPAGAIDQVLVADELVTILLQDRAGERAPADDENRLIVLLELIHQRDESRCRR